MVEVEGKIVVVEAETKISKKWHSILIDSRYNHSYLTPKVVENCSLNKCKHNKQWLVHLAMGTKRKVSEMVEIFPLELNGLFTWENLNICPLGSYDFLIGMDWWEA